MDDQEIKYFVSTKLGQKLPFAIVSHEMLMGSNDIFEPSLRDFHVIFWVKKGEGSFFLDFQEYTFKANTLIFITKDQLHYFLPFNKAETEIISIGFMPEFVYRNDSDLEHLFKFNASAHLKEEQTLPISNQSIEKLENLSKEMATVCDEWNDAYKANGFYHYLCLFLMQCEMMQEQQRGGGNGSIDEDIINYLAFNELLEQHYKTEFKVDFYTEKLNMTVKSLGKLTKAHYKLSPKTVIDDRRVLEIKRQLQGTSKSGKTIAYELNFGEPTNMFKFFKKHVGLTPKEFRAQV